MDKSKEDFNQWIRDEADRMSEGNPNQHPLLKGFKRGDRVLITFSAGNTKEKEIAVSTYDGQLGFKSGEGGMFTVDRSWELKAVKPVIAS